MAIHRRVKTSIVWKSKATCEDKKFNADSLDTTK